MDLPPPAEPHWLANADAFAAFITAWEQGRLPKRDWTHAAHVAVGACYAVRFGPGALDRLREGILRYNAAVGTPNTDTSGYHETLTRFWAAVLAAETAGLADEWDAARRAVTRFGHRRDLHLQYYVADPMPSPPARRHWHPPDAPGVTWPPAVAQAR